LNKKKHVVKLKGVLLNPGFSIPVSSIKQRTPFALTVAAVIPLSFPWSL